MDSSGSCLNCSGGTCNIASDAWKAWADALKASKDIRNTTLNAYNALKLEPSSSLVDAKILEAAIESSNTAVKASALAVKAVYGSLAHQSFEVHGPHAQNLSTHWYVLPSPSPK
jgi:hypothetical protein